MSMSSIHLDDELLAALRAFCMRWNVRELALFGSFVRGGFRADSDLDVLVELPETHQLSLFDWVEMRDELTALFGRDVDLVAKSSLVNPYRRRSILQNREVLYAA